MQSEKKVHFFEFEIFTGDKRKLKGVINTLNPNAYIVSKQDNCFREALLASDYIVPDGIGIKLGVRILHDEKIDRMTGSDLHEYIIQRVNKVGGACFYLGSSEHTLHKIQARLSSEQPNISSAFFSPPFREAFSEDENKKMIEAVNEFRPDVLFVGMTAPKQEKWVYQNRDKLNVPLICSIGAVFDFYAGTVRRPGKFWISLGLEWLPRLLREPRRLWRRNFISSPLFMLCVLREKFRMILQP